MHQRPPLFTVVFVVVVMVVVARLWSVAAPLCCEPATRTLRLDLDGAVRMGMAAVKRRRLDLSSLRAHVALNTKATDVQGAAVQRARAVR